MAIANYTHNGGTITLWDENGRQTGLVYAPNPGDRVVGLTGATVSVKKGAYITTYDKNGRQVGMHYAGN